MTQISFKKTVYIFTMALVTVSQFSTYIVSAHDKNKENDLNLYNYQASNDTFSGKKHELENDCDSPSFSEPCSKKQKTSWQQLESSQSQKPSVNLEYIEFSLSPAHSLFEVIQHIKNGMSVNVKDENGTPLLLQAFSKKNTLLTDYLLQIPHININQTDEYGCTLLMYALEAKDAYLVKKLLSFTKVELSSVNPMGHTLFMYGSLYSHLQLVHLLCKQSPENINKQDIKGFTALLHAAKEGNVEIVRCLLQVAALNPNLQSYEQDSALSLALEGCHYEIIELLSKDPRVEINLKHYELQYTPLLIACYLKDRRSVEILLSSRAGEAPVNNSLGHATSTPHQIDSSLTTLPQLDVDAQDKFGNSPILVPHNSIDIILRLLTFGADVNLKNNQEHNFLYYALYDGGTDIFYCTFFNTGAKVNEPLGQYASSLDMALRHNHQTAIQCLLRASHEEYLTFDTDVNKISPIDNLSPLMFASVNPHVPPVVLDLLLAHSMLDVNLYHPDNGQTAVMFALRAQNFDAASKIMAHVSFDITHKDNFQRTILTYFVVFNAHELLKSVMKNVREIFSKDYENAQETQNAVSLFLNSSNAIKQTPFLQACLCNNEIAAELFLNDPLVQINLIDDNGVSGFDATASQKIKNMICQRNRSAFLKFLYASRSRNFQTSSRQPQGAVYSGTVRNLATTKVLENADLTRLLSQYL